MSKPDDSSLPFERLTAIRREAEKVLHIADAFGQFPTPVNQIMDRAKVILDPTDAFDDGLVKHYRKKFRSSLKQAISKVCGIFDAGARVIYIDRKLLDVKQTFVKLHETAHGFLPWQRKLYAAIEDCRHTIDSDLADEFDREANAFASEVLFQCDTFTKEAADYEFGINTPLKLSKKYGASVYATIRRYVRTHHRTCAVLILNMPEVTDGKGFIAKLRRYEESDSFSEHIAITWPQYYTPDDPVGAIVPLGGKRMSRPRIVALVDANGTIHECVAEAFTQTYQVFILLCPATSLKRTSIVRPAFSTLAACSKKKF